VKHYVLFQNAVMRATNNCGGNPQIGGGWLLWVLHFLQHKT
jgi:hypothetical protein